MCVCVCVCVCMLMRVCLDLEVKVCIARFVDYGKKILKRSHKLKKNTHVFVTTKKSV